MTAARPSARAVSLVTLVVLALLAPAARAASPGESCQRTLLTEVSRLYRHSFACWSKGLTSFTADPFVCLAKEDVRFRKAYASAQAKAQKARSRCGLELDVESVLSIAAGDVDPIVFAIAQTTDFTSSRDLKLRARRINAAATFTGKAFDAQIGFTKDGKEARRDSRLVTAQTSLTKTFAGALTEGNKHEISYDGVDAVPVGESLGIASGMWERLTRPGNGAFTVSGTVFAAEATFADSDVNDVSTAPAPNNQGSLAQPLPVPSTVGGYANLAGAGPQGHSFSDGDTIDFYLASLRAGQVVVLVLGDDPNTVDLDMCLSRPGYSECAQGTGSVEMLTAPSDGTYFIRVFPSSSPLFSCDCGGTYTLSIGQTVPEAALRAERTDVEFVPGQLIVKMRDSQPAAGLGALRVHPKPVPEELGLETVAGDSSRELLVRLPADAAGKAAAFNAMGVANARQILGQSLTGDALARSETVLALKALRRRPEVESVELNTILRASAEPSDTYFDLQWHYPLIHLPQAWDVTVGDPNVIVAVIDTGVRFDHQDLQDVFVPGYDFIMDPSRARDGDGIDVNPSDPGDRGAGAGTSSFHGTHVAGTIAAATNNGLGVAGVSWGARVMPVRVLGVNGGTQYDVLQGVRFAAGLENDSGTLPVKRADVINLSLGGGGFNDTAQTVFAEARAAGVIVVAAAGNSGSAVPSYPASYVGVVSVAAVDMNRNRAPYSNYGAAVDIAAPGGDTSVDRNGDGYADGVLSTLADDSVSPPAFVYAFYQGTSMATPHVAGVFALMRSVSPTITPATIDSLLAMGLITEDLGVPGRDDDTGWGLIHARAAVLEAGADDTEPQSPLGVTPTGLNFGLSIDSLEFLVANVGSDPLTVTSVTAVDSPPWLAIEASAAGGDGLGVYTATVTRMGQDVGAYTTTIAIASTAGTVNVPVIMRVGGATSSDAGYHYVLLVDAESLTPIGEVSSAASDGTYPFTFTNVPEGEYLVIAGSDQDNDGVICDGGEACGSYPTLGLPEPLALHADAPGTDFGTAFRQSLGTGASAASAIPTQGLRRRPTR